MSGKLRSCRFVLGLMFLSQGAFAQQPGQPLNDWKEGSMEIHHINTGGGNATFFILPDGTTMLIDAGALDVTEPRTRSPRNTQLRPDTTRQAGEWVARYINQSMSFREKDKALDYALITHFHDDHMGTPSTVSKKSQNGNYMLAGITEVGDAVPIRKMIDRGWPDYNFPRVVKDEMVDNYRRFLEWHTSRNGMKVEKAAPGKTDQIRLVRNPDRYKDLFQVRNIAANGEVWTGLGDNTRKHFPELKSLAANQYPSENMCSIALRISYGKFDYFSGGDLPGVLRPGMLPWQDMETPVARVVGPVDVHILDHHGNRDSQNEFLLATLRPRVMIVPVWSSDHPGHDVLDRMYSKAVYQGDRDVFATDMLDANKLVIGELLSNLKSDKGHIVVRVAPGGDRYSVYVLDDGDERRVVKGVFGPYEAR